MVVRGAEHKARGPDPGLGHLPVGGAVIGHPLHGCVECGICRAEV